MSSPSYNYAPHFLIGNFVLTYLVLTPRHWKQAVRGFDHNVAPREDIAKYGDKLVAEGKMSRRYFERVKRVDAASKNSLEHFPFFVGSMLFALHAGFPTDSINKFGLIYTGSRIGYALAYIFIETNLASLTRSAFWWASNISCIWAIVKSGKAINGV